jgi:hypothetical protein
LLGIYDSVSSLIHRAHFFGFLNLVRCWLFADQSTASVGCLARHWCRRESSSHMCSTSARRVYRCGLVRKVHTVLCNRLLERAASIQFSFYPVLLTMESKYGDNDGQPSSFFPLDPFVTTTVLKVSFCEANCCFVLSLALSSISCCLSYALSILCGLLSCSRLSYFYWFCRAVRRCPSLLFYMRLFLSCFSLPLGPTINHGRTCGASDVTERKVEGCLASGNPHPSWQPYRRIIFSSNSHINYGYPSGQYQQWPRHFAPARPPPPFPYPYHYPPYGPW